MGQLRHRSLSVQFIIQLRSEYACASYFCKHSFFHDRSVLKNQLSEFAFTKPLNGCVSSHVRPYQSRAGKGKSLIAKLLTSKNLIGIDQKTGVSNWGSISLLSFFHSRQRLTQTYFDIYDSHYRSVTTSLFVKEPFFQEIHEVSNLTKCGVDSDFTPKNLWSTLINYTNFVKMPIP